MAEAGKAKTQDNLSKNKRQNKGANPNHVFRKRQVSKPETGANVIYVSTKSALKVSKWFLDKISVVIVNFFVVGSV